jgi:hypothetical protein
MASGSPARFVRIRPRSIFYRPPSEQKRAVFDFEIEFLNGGGLQGQEFRLDIEGDDIDDDALARLLVEDLRLLMVASVRILDKRIITEPHKRR